MVVARASGMDLASSLKQNTFLTLGVRPVGGPGSARDGGTEAPPDGGTEAPPDGGTEAPPDGGQLLFRGGVGQVPTDPLTPSAT